jgi:hypothetical protein
VKESQEIAIKLQRLDRDIIRLFAYQSTMTHAARTLESAANRQAAGQERDRVSLEISALTNETNVLLAYRSEVVMREIAAAATDQQKFDRANNRRGAIMEQRARTSSVI